MTLGTIPKLRTPPQVKYPFLLWICRSVVHHFSIILHHCFNHFEEQYIYRRIHLKRETTLWISKSLRSFLPWGLAWWWLVRKNKFSSSKFWIYVGSKCIISKNRTCFNHAVHINGMLLAFKFLQLFVGSIITLASASCCRSAHRCLTVRDRCYRCQCVAETPESKQATNSLSTQSTRWRTVAPGCVCVSPSYDCESKQ